MTDELSARLLDALGPAAMVELTTYIALANLYDAGQRGAGHRVAGLRRLVRPRAPSPEPPRAVTDDPSSATGACCSPSATKDAARRPTPKTLCRRPGCAGTRGCGRRCSTRGAIW